MKPYHIHRLTVRNVLGVADFAADLDPKGGTVKGSNAQGKSSLLRAIGTALGLEKISLARLAPVKDGQPAIDPDTDEPLVPEVCLLLKGDGPDLRIRAAGDTRIVEEQEGAAWRRSKRPVGGLLSRLVDPLANPAAFLAAKPDQQIEWVLEALPCDGYDRHAMLTMAFEDEAKIGQPVLKPIPSGLHPLDDIEAVYDQVFSYRTDVGRERDLAKSTAERMLSSLPAEAPEDPSDQLLRSRQALDAIRSEIATTEERAKGDHARAKAEAQARLDKELARIKAEHLAKIHAIEDAHEEQAAELRAAVEKRIKELRAEADVKIDAIDTGSEDAKAEASDAYARACAKADEDHNAELVGVAQRVGERESLAANVAALDEAVKYALTDRSIRLNAREAEAEAAGHAARYAALTRALDAIKAYRANLAGSLPIRGLEIRLGEKREVLVDGIPWATVNTARKAQVALELAMLRSKAASDDEPRLLVALLDDAEHFDAATREALVAAAEAAGVQLILAEVNAGGGPLEVKA